MHAAGKSASPVAARKAAAGAPVPASSGAHLPATPTAHLPTAPSTRLPAAPAVDRGPAASGACACGGGCPRCRARAVDAGLATPATPLPVPLQQTWGPAGAETLQRVRLHHGPGAAASAAALDARAYTVGAHVVLGAGVRADADDPTLRHELAHTWQQGAVESGAGSLTLLRNAGPAEEADADRVARHGGPPLRAALALARQAVTSPPPLALAAAPRFAEAWRDFEAVRWGTPATARPLALRALGLMNEPEDRVRHGMALTLFLFENGMIAAGQQSLESTRSAWMLRHVSVDPAHGVPPMAGFTALAGGPEQLIPLAEAAARANDHTLAFELFGSAYQMLSWQLDAAGPRRVAELSGGSGSAAAVAGTTRAMFAYPLLHDAYRHLRRVLGFYRVLEAERRAAGDANGARQAGGLSPLLALEIRNRWAWDSDSGMTAEVENVVDRRRGDALRIHGENGRTLDVTALPGLEAPREVTGGSGAFSYQRQSMPALTDALFAQTELMVELQAEPAIGREFGSTPIDMNDLGHRLRVWRTMYGVWQGRGEPALQQLMSLIGRYLRSYTIHTAYDVDDFGTSYLADDMRGFPTDLADRAERDCGVYALTVAYEVYRTARAASPRLDLDFRLFTMPEHVTLVIDDRGAGEHYIVNNDQISPPRHGDVMEGVAQAYAPIRGMANLVTPAMETSIGTTALGDTAFRTQAWRRYRDNASWGIRVPAPAPDDISTPAQLRERAYREFYAAQRFYDEGSARLATRLDALATALAPLAGDARTQRLQGDMPAIAQLAFDVGLAFERAGPFAAIDTTRPDPALASRLAASQRFLFRTPQGNAPLLRAAMALLHWQASGATLSPAQSAIIALCDRVASFHTALQSYRSGGASGTL